MFSLQKLIGKDDTFFTLMEGSAEEARASVHALVKLVAHPEKTQSLETFVKIRREEKRLSQQLSEHLCKTFVTPLEREDIEALSNGLYKIPKTVEKFGERFMLAPQHVKGWDLSRQLAMLDKATEIVCLLVRELRLGVDLNKVRKQNEQLQHIEGDADKLMLASLNDLYTGDHSTIRVVVMKDLYEVLEKVFDRCRDVGNLVFHIVLRHS